eukprot:COSAG04_NODE_943_length_9239_cov_3.297155_8_plen_576_part_00
MAPRRRLAVVLAAVCALSGSSEQERCQPAEGSPGVDEAQQQGSPWAARPPPAGVSSRGLQCLYWTPIWRHRAGGAGLPLEGLAALVERVRQAQPQGTTKSNMGGWQSPGNLLEVGWVAEDAAFARLAEEVTRQGEQYLAARARSEGGASAAAPTRRVRLTRAWANVNEFGDSNAPHVHPKNHLACVVYIATGGDPTAKLELSDPRPNLHGHDLLLVNGTAPPTGVLEVLRPGAARALSVSAGTVVVFPASLQHWVWPHAGRKARISFSFNMLIEEAEAAAQPPPPPPPADSVAVALGSERVRDAVSDGRMPGHPLRGSTVEAVDSTFRSSDTRSVLELGWGTPVWSGKLDTTTLGRTLGDAAIGAARDAALPALKFKPNRHLVEPWRGADDVPLGRELRGAIYDHLGAVAAELCGSDGSARPMASDGTTLVASVRLLRTRSMVLSGKQRHQFAPSAALPPPGGSSAQLCGIVGLRSEEPQAFGELLLHDPRPAATFTEPAQGPKAVTVFNVREGSIVLFPCWLKFDLVLVGQSDEAARHAFLELSAAMRVDAAGDADGVDGDDASWLRVPAEHAP